MVLLPCRGGEYPWRWVPAHHSSGMPGITTLLTFFLQDAHSIIPHFDEGSSYFGVYDGHGGTHTVHVHCSVCLLCVGTALILANS